MRGKSVFKNEFTKVNTKFASAVVMTKVPLKKNATKNGSLLVRKSKELINALQFPVHYMKQNTFSERSFQKNSEQEASE